MTKQGYEQVSSDPSGELPAQAGMLSASQWQDAKTLLIGGGGIIFFLGIYGFQQERLMSLPYGTESFSEEDVKACVDAGTCEYFKDTVFLVLNNRCIAILFAMYMMTRTGEAWKNVPPLWKYFAISVSNVIATTCQYEALKYVSFP